MIPLKEEKGPELRRAEERGKEVLGTQLDFGHFRRRVEMLCAGMNGVSAHFWLSGFDGDMQEMPDAVAEEIRALTPKVLRPKARGCSEGATLGGTSNGSTPTGLRLFLLRTDRVSQDATPLG